MNMNKRECPPRPPRIWDGRPNLGRAPSQVGPRCAAAHSDRPRSFLVFFVLNLPVEKASPQNKRPTPCPPLPADTCRVDKDASVDAVLPRTHDTRHRLACMHFFCLGDSTRAAFAKGCGSGDRGLLAESGIRNFRMVYQIQLFRLFRGISFFVLSCMHVHVLYCTAEWFMHACSADFQNLYAKYMSFENTQRSMAKIWPYNIN